MGLCVECSLEEALWDRFIAGLQVFKFHSEETVVKKNYKFQEAVDLALAEEAASSNIKDMSSGK